MNVTYLKSIPIFTTRAEEQIAPELPADSYVDGATKSYRTELIWGLEAK